MVYEVITLRVPKKVLREIKALSSEAHAEKSVVLREVVIAGLREKKIQNAIAKYKSGRISFGKAVELSGTNYRNLIMEMRKHGEFLRYSKERLLKEVEGL